MRSTFLLVFLHVFLSISTVWGFDDSRKGFQLGIGLGYHSTSMDFEFEGERIGGTKENGLASSVKIGGGISDKFSLYYLRDAAWYSSPYSDGYEVKDVTAIAGISGIGATFFLEAQAPSAYFMGGFGIADFSAPFEKEIKADYGIGFTLGVGYEFANHWMADINYRQIDVESADMSSLHLLASTWQFALNYFFY